MEMRALAEAPAAYVRAVDPDAELVAAARAQPGEFLRLYDRYFDRVLGYARLRIRDAATCEDVTSHVFMTALAQIGRFRGRGSFAGWLFQIARNAVHDVHRQRVTEPLSEERAAVEPSPEERVLARERAEELHALIRLLQPEQQHLLALRYGAGLSFDEIGAILDSAPATVRVRLHRNAHESTLARDDVAVRDEASKALLEALGALLRARRLAAELSLRELSERTKISNAYLSELERGMHEPSLRVLRAVASALGLPLGPMLASAGLLEESDEGGREGGVGDTEAAIARDPALTEPQRMALLSVYRSFMQARRAS
ncbi:MAG TPA: sigma-70 family RNA polymerase sigma factor [Solirubrobacteraceae bacterium]